MMTLLTGLPGCGKTAYVVEKLLMPVAGKTEKATDPDGNTVEYIRKIHTNINGLLLDHEKIDEANLNNWQTWAKPGDLIVYDEVQKPWPLRATGSKKEPFIEALETHRHMGVDFILMTQHPMLVDSAISRLAGRHLHIRKLGSSRFATVYEWDGVSRTLLYKNAFAKAPWRRGKAVETMYRSAALHTKQKRKLPSLLYGAAFGLVAMLFAGPYVYARIDERIHPVPVVAKIPAPGPRVISSAAEIPVLPGQTKLPLVPGPELPAPGQAVIAGLGGTAVTPKPIGCVSAKNICKCFDSSGDLASEKPLDFCLQKIGTSLPPKLADLPPSLRDHPGPRPQPSAADLEMLSFVAKGRSGS